MYKQLLFCLETNSHAATDWIYIMETISKFYNLSNKIKLSQVYMNSKTRYNSKRVLEEIDKKTKKYTLGETYVIYCIDVDDFESNPDHVKEFNDISSFCNRNGYELIWFCHDIEEVFLGKRISDSEKVRESGAFRKKKLINSINDSMLLSSNNHRVHSSNILTVLGNYLESAQEEYNHERSEQRENI